MKNTYKSLKNGKQQAISAVKAAEISVLPAKAAALFKTFSFSKNFFKLFLPILSLKIFLLLFSLNVFAASSELVTMRVGEQPQKTRVVFDLKSIPNYSIQTLSNPNRLVIDFDKTQNSLSFAKKFLQDPRLFSIDVKNTASKTRVVLALHKTLEVNSFTLGKNKSGFERVVIDLSDSSSVNTPPKMQSKPLVKAPKVQEKQPKTTKVAAPQVIKPQKAPDGQSAGLGAQPQNVSNSTLTNFIKAQVPNKSKIIVAIDAGHGGKDTGAIGVGGIYEKNVTLDMAKRLQKLINQKPNMQAVMIRDDDTFIPLKERVQIAKSKNADMFISIHADAFEDERVKGGSVYVLSENGASSAMAEVLANSENGFLQSKDLGSLDSDVVYALSDMSREANSRVSRKLARGILQEMRKNGKMHKNTVQSANFAVLKTIEMPSLLIETAFISNPQEAKNLQNPKFQQKMAFAIAQGVNQFVNTYASLPMWGETMYVRYKVQNGDTLSEIADKYGVSIGELKRLNHIRNANQLVMGLVMKIPVSQKVLAGI